MSATMSLTDRISHYQRPQFRYRRTGFLVTILPTWVECSMDIASPSENGLNTNDRAMGTAGFEPDLSGVKRALSPSGGQASKPKCLDRGCPNATRKRDGLTGCAENESSDEVITGKLAELGQSAKITAPDGRARLDLHPDDPARAVFEHDVDLFTVWAAPMAQL